MGDLVILQPSSNEKYYNPTNFAGTGLLEPIREMKCPLLNLWLGQDGHDYPLIADDRGQRSALMEGIRTMASEFPDLRFALEYKPEEPLTHSFQSRAADTLVMAIETGFDNVGVCNAGALVLEVGDLVFRNPISRLPF